MSSLTPACRALPSRSADDHTPVVTGIGIISAIGCDTRSFAEALFAGRTGVCRESSDIAPAVSRVKQFHLRDQRWQNHDRSIRFAVAAARQAAREADIASSDPTRAGVSIASSKGGVLSFCRDRSTLRDGHGNPAPEFFADYWPSSPATAIAVDLGCKGPSCVPVAACAAGSHAIIAGARMIASGEADVVLAGATEASITPLIFAGFKRLGVLAHDGICRPFDRIRSGFVIGEGAAVIAIESRRRAEQRRAAIYGSIAGWAMASDAHELVGFERSGESVTRAILNAVSHARIEPSDIQYINAHATATKLNDLVESRAIRAAFKEDTDSLSISGTKPATGHLLGAAGALETAICLLAMRHNMVPPTLNLADIDPQCDLHVVADKAEEREIDVAMNLSFGFGGQIGVLVLKKG